MPSGRELNSASTQKVRSSEASAVNSDIFEMPPSSSTALARTAIA